MTGSIVTKLAFALVVGSAMLMQPGLLLAQQTIPTEPTQPTEPIDPIGPAPNAAESAVPTARVPTANMDADHIRQSLRRQGYYDIHGVQRDGSRYRVTAMKDGRTVELEIDARTGAVTQSRM